MIAAQIRAARLRSRLSQAALAVACGLGPAGRVSVARWERGAREPDRATLERIAAATGHTLVYTAATPAAALLTTEEDACASSD